MPPSRATDPPQPARELETRLGYRFQKPARLLQALTHRSWIQSNPAALAETDGDNERLEFLGDAVLGLRVAERLLIAFPASPEGELSGMRAWLVSARNLATVGERLELEQYLRLGAPGDRPAGRPRHRLLANALEAVMGAVHLDGGYTAAAAVIDRTVIGTGLENLVPGRLHEFAYKSALQEWAHAGPRPLPVYRVTGAMGPEHGKLFTVEVELAGVFRGSASGGTKKDAEQKAAALALAHLGLLPSPSRLD